MAGNTWDDPQTPPWLRGDVGWLVAARPPQTVPAEFAEQARVATNPELHTWVDHAQVLEERPLSLEFAVAHDVVDRTSSHRDEALVALRGLQRQLQQTGPWWQPGAWSRRAHLHTRITEQQRVVGALDELFDRANRRLGDLLPVEEAALREWQARQDRTIGRAVAAVQELRLREQRLLEERTVDPPADLVQTLGPPPSEAAGRRTWQAQALQLERARAGGGLHLVGEAARDAASLPPPTFSGTEADREAAVTWIVARDRAGWPVSPALRSYAIDGDLPGNQLRASRTVWLDGMHLTYPTGSPPLAQRLGQGPPPEDLDHHQLPQP